MNPIAAQMNQVFILDSLYSAGESRAETRGDGQRQVGSIPGKQSEKKCWRVRHESEDKQRLSGVRLHIYWLDWRW